MLNLEELLEDNFRG